MKLPFFSRLFASSSSGGKTDSPAGGGPAKTKDAAPSPDTRQRQPGEWSFVAAGEKYLYSEGGGRIALAEVIEDKSDAGYEAFAIRILEAYAGEFPKGTFEVSLRRDAHFAWVGKMQFTKIYAYIKYCSENNYNNEQIKFINSFNIILNILDISPYVAILSIDKIMDEHTSIIIEIKEKYKQLNNYNNEFNNLLSQISTQYIKNNYMFMSSLLSWLSEHKKLFSCPEKALAFLVMLQRIMEKQPTSTA
jgi:hypothetical protein